MAYESLTEQEQYEMWVHYVEMCYYEEHAKNKTAGLTSNNVNPADLCDKLDNSVPPIRQTPLVRTSDLATESSPSPGF